MEDDTVVQLPRPRASVADDPLLMVLRSGARRMLQQVIEAEVEAWYRKSLAIFEALGDRPKMAKSYHQLGLLAEAREDLAAALDWTVRCVALFPEFPHPLTGPGPHHLARLTRIRGMAALQESWQRCTGRPLPANVRTGVERMIREAGPVEG